MARAAAAQGSQLLEGEGLAAILGLVTRGTSPGGARRGALDHALALEGPEQLRVELAPDGSIRADVAPPSDEVAVSGDGLLPQRDGETVDRLVNGARTPVCGRHADLDDDGGLGVGVDDAQGLDDQAGALEGLDRLGHGVGLRAAANQQADVQGDGLRGSGKVLHGVAFCCLLQHRAAVVPIVPVSACLSIGQTLIPNGSSYRIVM